MNPGTRWDTPEGIEKVRMVVELAEAQKRGKGEGKGRTEASPGNREG